MEKFKVTHWTGEDACSNCGWPVELGDWAVEHEGMFFCSKKCAKEFPLKKVNSPLRETLGPIEKPRPVTPGIEALNFTE